LTPRGKLLALLRAATAGNPVALVVDLDLTRHSGLNGLAPSAEDDSLSRFLRSYGGPAPIILARPLLEDLEGQRLPQPVSAWYEPLPDSVARFVSWATVQFVQEYDGVIRRWRLWEPVCANGTPGVLPSIQLAVGAATNPATPPAVLAHSLARMAPSSCAMGGELEGALDVPVFGHTLEPLDETLPQRIIYSLTWPPDARPARMVRLANGTIVPALLRIPASQVTESAVDRRLLEGRVVVIGGSYADSRDWYATPLGQMPGMAVVVNAIESLRSYGQYGTGEKLLKWIVMVALVIITSLAYARFHPLVATLLVLPLIYLAVLPISFYLFRSGTWLGFTAPLLGIQLHELIASAEDAWATRGRRLHHGKHP
jgi:hypothetical protein